MKLLFFFLFNILFYNGLAQDDSVRLIKYTPEYIFKDGIYLSFDQLKNNSPILKSRIISSLDPDSEDFFEKLLSKDNIYIYDKYGVKKEVPVKNIWGYCNNGMVYINLSENFHRINIIGTLCHFIADVTVYSNTYYDPYYYYYSNNPYYYNMRPVATKSSEIRQFIFNFNDGKVYDYSVEGLEIVLMKDPELYDEYVSLKSKKKKELKFYYIRKFNERNPLYLPEIN
jgi:hypothetical protein